MIGMIMRQHNEVNSARQVAQDESLELRSRIVGNNRIHQNIGSVPSLYQHAGVAKLSPPRTTVGLAVRHLRSRLGCQETGNQFTIALSGPQALENS